MHVLLVQFEIAWENKAANHDRVRALLQQAAPPAGALVILPEMFATGYSFNVELVADNETQSTTAFLGELAREFEVGILAGLVAKTETGRGLNQAVLIRPDGTEQGRYTKVHPFGYAGETAAYDAGRGATVFPWGGTVLAPVICYDLRFPELFREGMRHGAEVFAVIANWPSARADHWRTLLAARAIENQAYVIGVNRIGTDPNEQYAGASLVIDPRGQTVAAAGGEETVLAATLDLDTLRRYRREFPVLPDVS